MNERWNPTHTGVVRSCADHACALFGIPSMRQARHTVVVDDRGDLFEPHS